MATIVLSHGESVSVQFEGTDGSFELHFDTTDHPNQIVVKETACLYGNVVGEGNSVLYQDDLSLPAKEMGTLID